MTNGRQVRRGAPCRLGVHGDAYLFRVMSRPERGAPSTGEFFLPHTLPKLSWPKSSLPGAPAATAEPAMNIWGSPGGT